MLLPRATGPVWIRVGALLDGACTMPLRDAHLVYDRREILFVGAGDHSPPRELVRPEQAAPDLDAPDVVAIPGLIDAHTHLFLDGGELDLATRSAQHKRPAEDLLAEALSRLGALARLGIAGVRDAGDKQGVGLALSALYRSDERPLMPYVESPGAAINHRGQYGGFMSAPLEVFSSPTECVASRIDAGADRIKLIATGIIDFKTARVVAEPQMTRAEILEIVSAARAHARQTFAHASGDLGLQRVIDGGVDSVEHGYFVRDDQLARMRDGNIAWVPTFAPLQKQIDHAAALGWDAVVVGNLRAILDRHAESMRRAHAMGVRIVAGSDAGSFGVTHGHGLLDEMEWMERAGLSPIQVVNAATGAGAERFGYGERIGRIAPGYRSRFILASASMLEKLSNLRRPLAVIFDGDVL